MLSEGENTPDSSRSGHADGRSDAPLLAADRPESDSLRRKCCGCVLGEDLVLFRTTKGTMGLVQERCPTARHRWHSAFQKTRASTVPTTAGTSALKGVASASLTTTPRTEQHFQGRIKIDAYEFEHCGWRGMGLHGSAAGAVTAPVRPVVLDRHRSIKTTISPATGLGDETGRPIALRVAARQPHELHGAQAQQAAGNDTGKDVAACVRRLQFGMQAAHSRGRSSRRHPTG